MAVYYGSYCTPALYAWQHRHQLEDVIFYRRLADRVGGNAAPRILELGCGTGRLSIPLAEAGFPVTGVDTNLAMLAYAEKQRRRLEFLHADVTSMNLQDRWDLILFPYHSISHGGSYREESPELLQVYE